MPLKIVAGRNKKTKNLYIRGTHLKIRIDQTCGTDRRSVARRMRDDLERAIERGEHPAKASSRVAEPTFLSAAIRYLEIADRSKKTRRYVDRLGNISAAGSSRKSTRTPSTRPQSRCIRTLARAHATRPSTRRHRPSYATRASSLRSDVHPAPRAASSRHG